MTATRRNLNTPKARAANAKLDASYARQDAAYVAAELAARQDARYSVERGWHTPDLDDRSTT